MKYFPVKLHDKYILFHTGKVYSLYSKRFMKDFELNKSKYRCITFNINGKKKKFLIHRLIGLNFIPNPKNKRFIDHINRKRDDNRINNLKWATRSENNNNTKSKGYTKFFHKQQNLWKIQWKINHNPFKKKGTSFKTELEANKFIEDNYPFPFTRE